MERENQSIYRGWDYPHSRIHGGGSWNVSPADKGGLLHSQGDVHFPYLAGDGSQLLHESKKHSFSLSLNSRDHLMLQR